MIAKDQPISPDPVAELPAHIADTVTGMAKVHSDHHQDASRLDLIFAKIAAWLGHPGFTLVLSGFVVIWIGANLALQLAGRLPPDPPPFPLLSGLVALAALYMTGIILTTQRREDIRAERREQLTLELAIVIDQKASKLIALVEKLRLDHPDLVDHFDPEAQAMSAPADPEVVLNAIKKSHTDTEAEPLGRDGNG